MGAWVDELVVGPVSENKAPDPIRPEIRPNFYSTETQLLHATNYVLVCSHLLLPIQH